MNETIIVSVKEGKLRGIKKKSKFSGSKFYSFYEIPYGEPPLGNLRFKDPVKAKVWKGIRDATVEKNGGCTQYSPYSFTIIGSEDCLYMNIYTSQLPSEGTPLKAVIVCIHPGSLMFGSPKTGVYGSPDFIMDHDVVYVCIAFRLHILGFLNLNIKECSGNQGLKDIILALQWIQENIHNFNGDPNNVTLYGSSSGAISINALMMSPVAKGLFHKAVLSCFIFLTYTLFEDDNEAIAFRLARIMGFESTNRTRLLNFLKHAPTHALIEAQRLYQKQYREIFAHPFPHGIFVLTVDAASENPVLPISPRKLIDTITPVPLIFGICHRESVLGFATDRMTQLTEKNYGTSYRQNHWTWMYDLTDDEMKILHEQVEEFYFKDYPNRDAPVSVKVDMLSEIALHDVYDTLINPVAKKLPSSVYLHRFFFDSKMSSLKCSISLGLKEKISGSYHGCDFSCWNYNDYQIYSERDVRMIKTYTKLITTFAKNGDPNHEQLRIQWRPTTVEKPCYLSIDDEMQMVDGEYFQESIEFWKNIKKQFKKN